MKPAQAASREGNRRSTAVLRIGLAVTALLILLLLLAGCSGKEPNAKRRHAGAPAPVVVAPVVRKTVPERLRAIGTVDAYATVKVKSRVDGEITQVHFTEGQAVRAGQRLFTIDRRPFQALRDQARANLRRDRAMLDNARAQARRYAELAAKHFVSREMYAQYRTNAATAAAAVQGDHAAVENAKLQLAYCTIRSPIDGVTGALQVQAGNLVKANDTGPLVVIKQVRPIDVAFAVPSQNLSRIRRFMAHGPLALEALPAGHRAVRAHGVLTFVDNAVNTATGTILLKGVFANRGLALWPGQFIRITLILSQEKNALVVPSQAVQQGPAGAYVFVVRPRHTVEQRRVATGRTVDGETVIRDGLKQGEQVVIDGQLRLTDGARIQLKAAP